MLVDIFTIILIVFVGVFILLPIYINVFKEKIWEYIREKIKIDEKIENTKKDLESRR